MSSWESHIQSRPKHSPITPMTPQVDRPNKRARVVPGSESKPSKPRSTARLFAPFRALGFISNHVPFALQVRSAKGALKGPNVNIVSCLGRSWAMWDAGKMNLLFVGESHFSHYRTDDHTNRLHFCRPRRRGGYCQSGCP